MSFHFEALKFTSKERNEERPFIRLNGLTRKSAALLLSVVYGRRAARAITKLEDREGVLHLRLSPTDDMEGLQHMADTLAKVADLLAQTMDDRRKKIETLLNETGFDTKGL